MATKNVTIRMPEDLAEWISKQGDSINQAIIELLNNARYARMYALNELRGVFRENEWLFLADSLNGNYVRDQFRFNKKGLIGHCEDSEDMCGLATNHKVDLSLLVQKIEKLSASQIEAVYYRVEQYWEISELPDDGFNKQEKHEDWESF